MKKIVSIIYLLLVSTTLWAEPIGEQRAREIAEAFFSQHTTRYSADDITLEWAGDKIGEECATGSKLNTSLIYIYNRGTNDGFVIVAGDTNVTPIIAYSLDTTLDAGNLSEATAAILDAWCRQVENARQVARPISGTTKRAATRTNDAIRYETALWNQSAPYNNEAPIIDGYRAVTGCVATAMSIICHYHNWPEKGVGTTPAYEYETFGGYYSIGSNTLSRTYDYENMLMSYNDGYTSAQGNAVAALMKDMGTSVKMMYHYNSSGAYDADVIAAFTKYFGYSKSLKLTCGDSYSAEEWNNILRENIREYGPTYFSGASNSGGHAFVVDGFDTDDYFHFNFGWGGVGNGYFLIPSIDYYKGQVAILYLEPDRDGTSKYRDNIMLCPLYSNGELLFTGIKSLATSYATGEQFTCLLGGFQNFGTETFIGTIKLVLCDRNGIWKEELYSEEYTIEPNGYSYYGYYATPTITSTLEEGDRLRIYYKSDNFDEWQWALSNNSEYAVNEVLVKGSPEDMAKGYYFAYDKSTQKMYVGNKHAMSLVIYVDETNEQYAYADFQMNTTGSITGMPAGTYRIEVSLGGEPYVLIVKL